MPVVETLIAVGEAGVALLTAEVVIPDGALARLVWVKVKAPPKPPVVVFWTFTVGIFALLKRQV